MDYKTDSVWLYISVEVEESVLDGKTYIHAEAYEPGVDMFDHNRTLLSAIQPLEFVPVINPNDSKNLKEMKSAILKHQARLRGDIPEKIQDKLKNDLHIGDTVVYSDKDSLISGTIKDISVEYNRSEPTPRLTVITHGGKTVYVDSYRVALVKKGGV